MPSIQSTKNFFKSFSPKPWPLEKPTVIQFPVNDICNSKCQMCHIWKQKRDNEITPEELQIALKNTLYSEVTSVGLNGGEPTLREDLADIAKALFDALPKIKNISLITNGINVKQITKRINDLAKVISSYGGHLDVMVSLDGIGETHDIVRGRPGNFKSACKVLDYANQHKAVNNVRIGCTVIKSNVYGIYDLLNFAREQGIYIKYRLGVPHPRLYSENVCEPFDLSEEEVFFFCTFLENLILDYEKSFQQNIFYRSLIDQLLFNAPRKASCDWQHRGATISSRGDLSYCAIASPELGNIIKSPSQLMYYENEETLKNILDNDCKDCRHDYVGLPDSSQILNEYIFPLIKTSVNELIQQGAADRLIEPIISKRKFKKYRENYINYISSDADIISEHPCAENKNNILLCGWYGTETIGDKAILAGVINSVKENINNTKFYVASLNPHITNITCSQMPELGGVSVLSYSNASKIIDDISLLVFAGGPIMALNELTQIELLFSKAKTHNIPSLIAGCGVGPLKHTHHNNVIQNILNTANKRIYRDNESLNSAQKLGVNTSQDITAEDPAFSWIHSSSVNSYPPKGKNKTLLLGLREWPHFQYATNFSLNKRNDIQNKFELELMDGIKRLVKAHSDLEIVPIPMCSNHFGGNDIWYYYKLFNQHKEITGNINFDVLRKELPPADVLEQFRMADSVLAMRFHSLVFAIGSNTPTTVIDYTMGKGKVHSLANKYSLPCKPVNKIDSDFIFQNVHRQLAQNAESYYIQPENLQFNVAMSKLIKISHA